MFYVTIGKGNVTISVNLFKTQTDLFLFFQYYDSLTLACLQESLILFLNF